MCRHVSTCPSHLQRGGEDIFLSLGSSQTLLCLVNGHLFQTQEEILKDHVQRKDVLREPDHATATDCGQGSVAEVLHFKHHTNLGGGESECLLEPLYSNLPK